MSRILTSSLLLLLCGSRPFSDLPEPVRAWAPVLRLGSVDGRTDRGLVEVARLLRLSRAFALDRTLDAESKRMLSNVRHQLETLDFRRLYRMLPAGEDPTRMFVFSGRLRLTGGYDVRARSLARPARFGDAEARITLAPARKNSFLLTTHLLTHLGVTAEELYGCAADALSWFRDRAAVPDRRPRGLSRSDRSVLDGLAASFPATASLASRYLEARDVSKPSPRGPRVRLAVRLKRAAFAADYPRLAEAAAGAARMLSTRVRAMTDGGRTLGIWKFDSGRMEGVVSFEPDIEALVQPRYRFEADLLSNAAGVEVSISKVRVQTDVNARPKRVVFASRMHRMPDVSVEGAALDLIPVEVIDALIPSNLSGIIRGFLSVLTTGDGGKGLSWTLSLPRSGEAPIRTTTRAELLDNGFVSFWLRIASRAIGLDEEVRDELESLLAESLDAVRSDFDRMQAAL